MTASICSRSSLSRKLQAACGLVRALAQKRPLDYWLEENEMRLSCLETQVRPLHRELTSLERGMQHDPSTVGAITQMLDALIIDLQACEDTQTCSCMCYAALLISRSGLGMPSAPRAICCRHIGRPDGLPETRRLQRVIVHSPTEQWADKFSDAQL
jgi:hypothetical protein